MSNFIFLLFFVVCNLTPDGVKNFELELYPNDDQGEKGILYFNYQEDKKAWEVYPEEDESDRGLLRVDATHFYLVEPEQEELDVQDFLALSGKEKWQKIKEVKFQNNDPEYTQTPFVIKRDLKAKTIQLSQEEGELNELGSIEIRWK